MAQAADHRHDHMASEPDEEEEEDELNAAIPATVRFTESPSYVKGGKMRAYQVAGLNWLIDLFEHHVNGILADEMVLRSLHKSFLTFSFCRDWERHSRHFLY